MCSDLQADRCAPRVMNALSELLVSDKFQERRVYIRISIKKKMRTRKLSRFVHTAVRSMVTRRSETSKGDLQTEFNRVHVKRNKTFAQVGFWASWSTIFNDFTKHSFYSSFFFHMRSSQYRTLYSAVSFVNCGKTIQWNLDNPRGVTMGK